MTKLACGLLSFETMVRRKAGSGIEKGARTWNNF